MKLYLGCDHAAFEAKESLKKFLMEEGHQVEDLGAPSLERCNYPDYAAAVAKKVQETGEKGILLCGSGIGVSMVANRFKKIRAALCRTTVDAELSRQHNDANVLCVGARINSETEIQEITKAWFGASFEEGRHSDRIALFNNWGE
ncbi:MAG: ribose 5-phosphate isomerase B [Halobacteriovoraceae bacterium]|jgi:ribose 5-phosphate isomerase B|nr:ribose 5-phosphate isomerase B [Halobacteriovoraceae bacterium]